MKQLSPGSGSGRMAIIRGDRGWTPATGTVAFAHVQRRGYAEPEPGTAQPSA